MKFRNLPPSGKNQATRRSHLALVVVAALGLATLPVAASSASAALTNDPAQYVNTFIGTSNAGNTYPGAVAPFGMLAWSPDTMNYNGPTSGVNDGKGTMRSASPSGYEYGQTHTRGFSLTHVSGAGCAGLSGDIPFFPVSGNVTTSPLQADAMRQTTYRSNFTHANENAAPGTYGVKLTNGVDVDLAATTRTGSGNFKYPTGQPATMLVRTSDSILGSEDATINIDQANKKITGSVTSGNFCGSFVGDGSLRRSYYTVHFVAEFDTAFTAVGTWNDATVTPGSTSATGGTGYTGGLSTTGTAANSLPPAGKGSGGYVTFAGNDVNVRVGISYVSASGAQANLNAENPAAGQPGAKTIAEVKSATRADWNAELGRIDVGGGTDAQKTTFYSGLYHSLFHPNIIDDVTGQYPGFEHSGVKTLPAGQTHQYTTYSGWDVYRSQIQLVTLLDPKRGSDIARSLLNQANQNNGVWDRWSHVTGGTHVMVGDPSAVSIASIAEFGGTDFPIEEAYNSLAQAARVPTAADLTRVGWNIGVAGQRPSLDQYLDKGYYPQGCNAWGCPNETLEMISADYGLATLATRLGKTADYQEFAKRSQNWQNQFNPNATDAAGYKGYFQQRLADGTWKTGFDYSKDDGFVEGTAAVYAWMVQHNPAGLFEAMGGNEIASQRLDRHFREGDGTGAWHLTGSWNNNTFANMDNEPSVGVPWLYNYMGKPWKTQETIRATVKQLWLDKNNGPGGIPGNDDLGQMSSWLVFAAMGIYPQNPSRAELAVAAPLFPNVEIKRANGVTIKLNAPGATIDTQYISDMKIDGVSTSKNYLPASVIGQSSTVDFTVSDTANTTRGTAASDAPPSDRTGENQFLTEATPGTVSASRGGLTSTVRVLATPFNQSATGLVTYTIDAPAGITAVNPTGSLFAVKGSPSFSADLQFRVDQSVPAGVYTVTVNFGNAGNAVKPATIKVEVGNQVEDIFRTGFESSDVKFTAESDRLTDPAPVNIGEFCCSIGGLESKVSTDQRHSGAAGAVFSGRATGPNASAANYVVRNLNAGVVEGSQFSYWIHPQKTGGPFADYIQDASKNIALDLLFTDGTRLSELPGVVASNGAGLRPEGQGTKLVEDTWNEVKVVLPAAANGKIVKDILLTFGSGSDFVLEAKNGYARGWFDDIRLFNPVAPLSLIADGGLNGEVGQNLSGTLASFTGGKGQYAGDFTATVNWGDGTSSAGVVKPTAVPGAYSVSGTHTYATSGVHNAIVTVTDRDNIKAMVSVASTIKVSTTIPGGGTVAIPATITATTKVAKFGTTPTVTAVVTAKGTVPAGTVTVLEGSAVRGWAKTSAGKASVTLPKDLKVGTHRLTVVFTPGVGSKVSAPTPKALTLSVAKASAKLKSAKANKGKLSKKKTTVVTIQLKGVGAAAVTGKVSLKVGKKVIGTASVKKSGSVYVAKVKVAKSKLKKAKIKAKVTAVYSGNGTYTKTTFRTKLAVKK